MSIKESALSAITSISNSDFVRVVTSAGASRRITVSNLAKQIIEGYAGSTQSLTPTTGSGSGKVSKVGQVVTVRGAFTGYPSAEEGWKEICVLPSGYVPSTQVDILGFDNNTNSISEIPMQIRITTEGAVRFYAWDAKNYAPYFCVTFII